MEVAHRIESRIELRPAASPLAWLRARHAPLVELAGALAVYGLFETSRGLVVGDLAGAVRHAHLIAGLERSLHVFVEADVQHAAGTVPGLLGALGLLYLTLHLTATVGCLAWLHRRRPTAFPLVRTALLLASALALVGYLLFPAAPPRLAALGVADTISRGGMDMNHGLVSSLYNPFAAFPSVHITYAVIVGAAVFRYGSRPAVRALGALYPLFVLLEIVATGNHFFVDAAGGAAVAAVALAGAVAACRRGTAA